MIPEIEARIDQKLCELQDVAPSNDPALAPWADQLATVVRRVQAFEGWLIAGTIPAVLADAPHLSVIPQPRVALPRRAVERAELGAPPLQIEYDGSGRGRRLDLLVFDHRNGVVELAEIKRGCQPIGADHRRNRLRDDAALRMVGVSYVEQRLRVRCLGCQSRVLSYYGRTGLPEDLTLRASELDAHYGWPVQAAVEAHLNFFRHHLDWAIPGLTGQGD